jgi:cytosine/creatinine deaminase
MLAPATQVKTPKTENPLASDLQNIKSAVLQGELGLKEGGVPIGAALFNSDGVCIGVGRNRRVQQGSATRHGEVSAFPGYLSAAKPRALF